MTDTRLQFLGDEGEYWIFGFGDLVFRTETLSTARADRVIPLGEAAGRIMDYMVRHQDEIRGARILEPFCGCGPMALLALHLDASHVCAVDINPRALEFLDDNCRRNRPRAMHRMNSSTGSLPTLRSYRRRRGSTARSTRRPEWMGTGCPRRITRIGVAPDPGVDFPAHGSHYPRLIPPFGK